MGLPEIEQSRISLRYLEEAAFPPERRLTTPIPIFAKSDKATPRSDEKSHGNRQPLCVDLRESLPNVTSTIKHIDILALPGIPFCELDFRDPIGSLTTRFRDHLKNSLPNDNVLAIDVIKSYRRFLEELDENRKYKRFTPDLRKMIVLESYLRMMGVTLIKIDSDNTPDNLVIKTNRKILPNPSKLKSILGRYVWGFLRKSKVN